jgi:hypothetical protein
MEAFWELLLSVAQAIIKALPFKKETHRIWTMTIFFALVFALLLGILITAAIELYQLGSTEGSLAMGVFSAIMAVVSPVIVICGHRREWKTEL